MDAAKLSAIGAVAAAFAVVGVLAVALFSGALVTGAQLQRELRHLENALELEFRRQLTLAIADFRSDVPHADLRVAPQPHDESVAQTLSQLQELRSYVVQHFDDFHDFRVKANDSAAQTLSQLQELRGYVVEQSLSHGTLPGP